MPLSVLYVQHRQGQRTISVLAVLAVVQASEHEFTLRVPV